LTTAAALDARTALKMLGETKLGEGNERALKVAKKH
tara:strand:+ start:1086 stop:1193 length:108 start_codon:yes stop_codon:yes gene_type:complete